jgi:hypothetical protein
VVISEIQRGSSLETIQVRSFSSNRFLSAALLSGYGTHHFFREIGPAKGVILEAE